MPSHKLATGSYHKSLSSNSPLQAHIYKIHFNIIPPFLSLQSGLFPWGLQAKMLCEILVSYSSHPTWFNHPNNSKWRIKIIKVLIM
jgi:hypothetical protein